MVRRLCHMSALTIFLVALASFALANGTFTGKVVGVSDGDTIKVMRAGRTVKVRLHGIDCPEKGQPFGERAKQFTSDKVFGKEVEVRIVTTDRYGRLVGEVILPDGKSLNKELVSAGLAWWYRKNAPDDRTLRHWKPELVLIDGACGRTAVPYLPGSGGGVSVPVAWKRSRSIVAVLGS